MKHVSNDGVSPLKILQNEIENDLKSKLYVPEKSTNPDKLIIAARESLNSKDRYEHNGCYYVKGVNWILKLLNQIWQGRSDSWIH